MSERGCDHITSPAGITKIVALCCCLLAIILLGAALGSAFSYVCQMSEGVICPFIVVMFLILIFFIIDLILRVANVYNCGDGTLYSMDMIFCLFAACLALAVSMVFSMYFTNTTRYRTSALRDFNQNIFNIRNVNAVDNFMEYNESLVKSTSLFEYFSTEKLTEHSTDKSVDKFKSESNFNSTINKSTVLNTHSTVLQNVQILKLSTRKMTIVIKKVQNLTSKINKLLKTTVKLGYKHLHDTRIASKREVYARSSSSENGALVTCSLAFGFLTGFAFAAAVLVKLCF